MSSVSSVFPKSLKNFPSKRAKTASDECLPHVAVSKELDDSYANVAL